MTTTIDARNTPCSQPVVLAREALEKAHDVTVIVDNEVAKENVSRFGKSLGASVSIKEEVGNIYITLKMESSATLVDDGPPIATDTVILIVSDILGRGKNTSLGSLLMQSFLHTVIGFSSRPEAIVLMDEGVKLVTEDSAAIGELRQLDKGGTEVIACGTCLSRLELVDKVAVGRVSNMYTITDLLLKARKVISL